MAPLEAVLQVDTSPMLQHELSSENMLVTAGIHQSGAFDIVCSIHVGADQPTGLVRH